jgi:hypothetical protein
MSFTVLGIEAGRGKGKRNVIGAILERDYPQLTPGTGDAGGGANIAATAPRSSENTCSPSCKKLRCGGCAAGWGPIVLWKWDELCELFVQWRVHEAARVAPPYSHGQTVYFGAVRYRFVGYEDAGGTLQPADSDRCRVAEPASTVHLSGVLVSSVSTKTRVLRPEVGDLRGLAYCSEAEFYWRHRQYTKWVERGAA